MATVKPLSPIFDYDTTEDSELRLVTNFDGLDLRAALDAMNNIGNGGSSSPSGVTDTELASGKLEVLVAVAEKLLSTNDDYEDRESFERLEQEIANAKTVIRNKPDSVSAYTTQYNKLLALMDSIIVEGTNDYWSDVKDTSYGDIGLDGDYPNYSIDGSGNVVVGAVNGNGIEMTSGRTNGVWSI